MLFFNKSKNSNEVNKLGNTGVLKEICLHFDNDNLNQSLTNLEEGSWVIQKQITNYEKQNKACLTAFRTDFSENSSMVPMNISTLNNEVLALELVGINEEFYLAEVIIKNASGNVKSYYNIKNELVGLVIDLIGDIDDGITDFGE